jgi:hypothetical protein
MSNNDVIPPLDAYQYPDFMRSDELDRRFEAMRFPAVT